MYIHQYSAHIGRSAEIRTFRRPLVKGQIVTSGGAELADVLERDGYAAFTGNDEEVAEESAPSSLDDLFKM